jgi:hypothetical protein
MAAWPPHAGILSAPFQAIKAFCRQGLAGQNLPLKTVPFCAVYSGNSRQMIRALYP